MRHNVVWKSQKDEHLPNVSRFDAPDDFLEQLNAQEYGPTMLLIADTVSWLGRDEGARRASTQWGKCEGRAQKLVCVELFHAASY